MYNIINNLYLGNRLDSIDFSNQFDVVINCTYDLPFYIYDLSINTIRIPIKNDSNLSAELLYNYFDFIVKLIFDSLNNNKKILIYCKFGEQRSVSIICAYLIWTNNWSVEYTIGFIKNINPNAFRYGVNFIDILNKWYNSLNLK